MLSCTIRESCSDIVFPGSLPWVASFTTYNFKLIDTVNNRQKHNIIHQNKETNKNESEKLMTNRP